ncbi:MAG: DHHA1 domain-containing protein, partial [Candidatus Ratteibacteria bacterium]|nr:DHHA1 domain-containing protein [Candidatus Ratteibacteria bacterium]
ILVKEGLRKIPFTPLKGLAYLIEKQKIKEPVYIKDVAMKITPLINSPGRFGKPDVSLKLLMEKNERHIREIVEEIEQIDRERYKIVTKTINNIKEDELESGFVISKKISSGMCGLIASRLTGKYSRPFLVGSISNDYVKGSIRAPENYDIHKYLKPLGRYMISLGGHKEAMGFKCPVKNATKIKDLWYQIKWENTKKQDYYDCPLDIKELNPSTIEEAFEYLQPFGKGNPEPVFLCKDVHLEKVSIRNSSNSGGIWLKKDDAIYETVLNGFIDNIPHNIKKADVLYTPYLRKHNNLYRIILKVRKIYSEELHSVHI